MDDFREYWRNPTTQKSIGVWRASSHTSIAELEFISELLLDWLDKEQALIASTFYSSRNIARATFYDWMERCPQLKWAWQVALQRIGERRELGGLKGQLNSGMIQASQPLYSKDYLDLKMQLMKHSDESVRQTIVVLRDKMPETDEVKSKGYEGAE